MRLIAASISSEHHEPVIWPAKVAGKDQAPPIRGEAGPCPFPPDLYRLDQVIFDCRSHWSHPIDAKTSRTGPMLSVVQIGSQGIRTRPRWSLPTKPPIWLFLAEGFGDIIAPAAARSFHLDY